MCGIDQSNNVSNVCRTYLGTNTSDLVDSNQVSVMINNSNFRAIIDTGSTISTLNQAVYDQIRAHSVIKTTKCNKQCTLADSSTINLETIVTVPLTVVNMTFNVNLFLLPKQLMQIIIGCDTLRQLKAVIDYNLKQFVVQNPTTTTETSMTLGYIDDTSVKNEQLNKRVAAISLMESDTDDDQKQRLIHLMNRFETCFANNLSELGKTSVIEYDIETVPNITPIRIKPYPVPYAHRSVVYEELAELQKAGLIKPSKMSQWGFPMVLVKKPRSDKMRCCLDLRKLNEKTIEQPYVLNNMDYLLADIGKRQCKYFSLLDLSNAFRQVPLSKRSQELCTMSTIIGDFSCQTACFGLRNLPFLFSKLLNNIFFSIRGKFMDFFLDDIIVYSATFEEHIVHLEDILQRLKMANLTCGPSKTFLCKTTIEYLGYVLSKAGVSTTNYNIRKIVEYKPPTRIRALRGFLGLCNYYRKMIKGYSIIAQPLYELTKKHSGKFKWTPEANVAFDTLKRKLTTAPVLAFPDMNSKEPLIVSVDSSSRSFGYTLSQMLPSDKTGKLEERPICYGSTSFKGSEKTMGSTDLELSGIFYALQKLRCYLIGIHFKLVTDHKSLIYLMAKNLNDVKPSIARKIIYLQQFDFEIIHKNGSRVPQIDFLSRYMDDSDSDNDLIDPTINVIADNKQCIGLLDIKDLGLADITSDRIRTLQRQDRFYNAMYMYLDVSILPSDKTLKRKIKSHCNMYAIENKLLYHIWCGKARKQMYKQLCVPKELRPKILNILHDTKLAGHKGVFKMYQEAISKVWWSSLYKNLQNYVSSCKLCLETNTGHLPKVPLKSLEIPRAPFKTIQIDLLSFHTPSKGYKYILVIIDSFSRHVVIEKTKNKNSFTIMKILYEKFILKYGFFEELCIISDNGTELVSSWSKALYKLLGITSIRTSVYKPSSNGLTERCNRSIIAILRRFVKDNPKKWADNLCYVAYVINSSVSESTKQTPLSLLFGVTSNVLDLCLPDNPEVVPKNMEQAYNYWFSNLTKLRKLARENIQVSKTIQKRNYDKNCRRHSFAIGDKVFIKLHGLKPGQDTKLSPHFKGYYTIHEFLGDTNVILKDHRGKLLPRSVYINNIKKFNDRIEWNTDVVESVRDDGDDGDVAEEESVELQDETDDVQRDVQNDTDPQDTLDDVVALTVNQEDTIVRDVPRDPMANDADEADDDQPLPFSQLDDRQLQQVVDVDVEEVEDDVPETQQTVTKDNNFEQIKKVYRKKLLPSGDIQYYLSWAAFPAKKHRCWVNRQDLSPELQKYVDTKKLPCTK